MTPGCWSARSGGAEARCSRVGRRPCSAAFEPVGLAVCRRFAASQGGHRFAQAGEGGDQGVGAVGGLPPQVELAERVACERTVERDVGEVDLEGLETGRAAPRSPRRRGGSRRSAGHTRCSADGRADRSA